MSAISISASVKPAHDLYLLCTCRLLSVLRNVTREHVLLCQSRLGSGVLDCDGYVLQVGHGAATR